MIIHDLFISIKKHILDSLSMDYFLNLSLIVMLCFGLLAQAEEPPQSETESICVNAVRTGNIELAIKLCEKQLVQAQREKDLNSELSLHIALMDAYWSDNDEAFYNHLEQAENHPLFQTSPHKKYKWLRLKAIKIHHYRKYKQSYELFSEALKIALELKDDSKIATSNRDLGISLTKSNDYKNALTHYRTSLEIFRQINDHYDSGITLKNVGNLHLLLEEYDVAIKFYEESLAEYTKYIEKNVYDSRVHHKIDDVYNSLLEVHQKSNNLSEAQRYQKLIEQSQFKANNDHNHDRANQLEQHAKQLMETEDYNEAAVQFTEALKLYDLQGMPHPAGLLYSLAKAYQSLGQDDLAIYYASQGVKNTNNNESFNIAISQNQQLLSQLYEKTDTELSLDFSRKYNQSRELFLASKYDTDLKTIQHQIELEKKQNELVTSQLQNTKQEVKIQKLNNKYLISLLVLICLVAGIIYLYIKKKREQGELFASINYHKNQLAVLSLATQPQQSIHQDTKQLKIKQETVNEKLVTMMHDATNLWVEHTGENLIELADRSKIWTITNDNGTLRARSLEKYLTLQKIPKNPRWRNVVRTCHFVLSETGLTNDQRKLLTLKLESLMKIIKDFYGTGK